MQNIEILSLYSAFVNLWGFTRSRRRSTYTIHTAASAWGVSTEGGRQTVYQTADGVLSIQLPGPGWVVLSDPNYWFAMTDGDDVITISHLSNGEALPPVTVADSEYTAVCHAYVSTENEVFVIKGCAVSQDSLKDIMLALSTVKILKYDTKVALNVGSGTAADQLVVDPYSKVLYSVSKHLNVRTDCTTDSRKLGFLTYGQPAVVNGIVRLNGRDYGWYRISYNNRMGYVSAKFLSEVAPRQESQSFWVYAENGAAVSIRDVSNGYYQDDNGHSYRYLHGSLYYRSDNDTTYSQDPTYCSRYQNSTEAFWVYSSDGGAVQIYSTADEEYRDAAGNIYFLNAGNIYYCHDTDVEYSPDPNHWADAQDNAYPSFPVYGEDGSRASIHWSEGDAAYPDESGTTYDLVSGNLYSRNIDQLLFSPDQHMPMRTRTRRMPSGMHSGSMRGTAALWKSLSAATASMPTTGVTCTKTQAEASGIATLPTWNTPPIPMNGLTRIPMLTDRTMAGPSKIPDRTTAGLSMIPAWTVGTTARIPMIPAWTVGTTARTMTVVMNKYPARKYGKRIPHVRED